MAVLHADADDRPDDQSVENALALLRQALIILDDSALPKHISARLQEVIELVHQVDQGRVDKS
ncbi:MAG TPA: hypothetical protein VJM15_01970 [Sphingomicrobium sp.]|nr:hypothetical protein [Sphingomicrobium sp.]